MFYLLFVELRECFFKVLIFFTSLFVTLLDIFDFYRLNFLQSVPLGLSLLSHLFPNQLLDSFLLRGEAEHRQRLACIATARLQKGCISRKGGPVPEMQLRGKKARCLLRSGN